MVKKTDYLNRLRFRYSLPNTWMNNIATHYVQRFYSGTQENVLEEFLARMQLKGNTKIRLYNTYGTVLYVKRKLVTHHPFCKNL